MVLISDFEGKNRDSLIVMRLDCYGLISLMLIYYWSIWGFCLRLDSNIYSVLDCLLLIKTRLWFFIVYC